MIAVGLGLMLLAAAIAALLTVLGLLAVTVSITWLSIREDHGLAPIAALLWATVLLLSGFALFSIGGSI